MSLIEVGVGRVAQQSGGAVALILPNLAEPLVLRRGLVGVGACGRWVVCCRTNIGPRHGSRRSASTQADP